MITADQHGIVFSGTGGERISWQGGELGQVQAVRTSNGDVNTEYGGGVAGVIAHADGSRTVYWENFEEKGPIVKISKDNQLTLRNEKGEAQTVLIDDTGVQSASAADYSGVAQGWAREGSVHKAVGDDERHHGQGRADAGTARV